MNINSIKAGVMCVYSPLCNLASSTMPGTQQNLNTDSLRERVVGETRHFCNRNRSVYK